MTKEENTNKETTKEQMPEQEYAVRPQHHYRKLEYSEHSNLKVRNYLNSAFILLALIGLVMWYTLDDHTPATIILLIGVVLKIAEVCIRLFHK